MEKLRPRQFDYIISALESELERNRVRIMNEIETVYANETDIARAPLQMIEQTFDNAVNSCLRRVEADLKPLPDVVMRCRERANWAVMQIVKALQHLASLKIEVNKILASCWTMAKWCFRVGLTVAIHDVVPWDKIPWDKIPWDKILLDKIPWDKIF